jgi:hypothetical protein
VERYQLGGANGEQRLAELRARHKPKFVNEDGQPFDPERDQVKRCDNNERLGAVCCHKLRSSDAKAEFELRTKLYAWVEVAAAEGRKKAQKRKKRCVPYDLRHAYAIRARETTSWSYADVAAVMGHSPEVHRRVSRHRKLSQRGFEHHSELVGRVPTLGILLGGGHHFRLQPQVLAPFVRGDHVGPQLLGDLSHALAMERPHPPADISLDGLAVTTHRSGPSSPLVVELVGIERRHLFWQ